MNNEKQDLDITYVLQTIGKWFLLILFFIILGLGIAIFYNYGAPRIYESKTSLYAKPEVESNSTNYSDLVTNQKMIKNYIQVLKSRKVMNKVITKLNLKMSYDNLLDVTSVGSIEDTTIITVSSYSESRAMAARMANTIAKSFIEELAESMEITNITVIDEAIISEQPVSPRIVFNAALGVLGGLTAGLIFAFLIESMNNKIKNHEDVKRYLRLKTLGVIPHNSIDNKNNNKKKDYVNPSSSSLKIISDPTSVISESIRVIRTNLNFMDVKLLNVTSTLPGEGKSEVLSNLALSFSMLDKKVLVVDCDLRRPKVHKNFGLTRKTGVSDIVLSKGELDYRTTIQTFTDEKSGAKIDIMSAGGRISNPSELINKKGFVDLLMKVKEDYDLVLIDCPPISSLTDGVLVSKLCDGTIYVIESDRTDYHVVNSSIEELQNNKVFILGAVLNKVNIKHQKKLYGYKYNYYYSNNQ